MRCQVDEGKRRLNARLHSAGHLLDVAIFVLGFRCGWVQWIGLGGGPLGLGDLRFTFFFGVFFGSNLFFSSLT